MDEKLTLQGINEKNMKAYEVLYSCYYAALCSYAENLVKDSGAAEDIVQEIMIKIWRSDKTYASWHDLAWYLYRAVNNNALYYLRTRSTHHNILNRIQTYYNRHDMSEEHLVETVRDEVIRRLYFYIRQLPKEQRRIMMLSLRGYSGKEIAGLLKISITTVKTQKHRGFKFLREKLGDSFLLLLLIY